MRENIKPCKIRSPGSPGLLLQFTANTSHGPLGEIKLPWICLPPVPVCTTEQVLLTSVTLRDCNSRSRVTERSLNQRRPLGLQEPSAIAANNKMLSHSCPWNVDISVIHSALASFIAKSIVLFISKPAGKLTNVLLAHFLLFSAFLEVFSTVFLPAYIQYLMLSHDFIPEEP